ncbi:MAG: hypothetical protein ABI267_08675 [Ginsengibacter sp.]
MEKLLIILSIFICFSLIVLLNKYRNTKAVFFIRFGWFAVGMGIFFFFFSQNYTLVQNLVMAFVTIFGLAYFGYNLKKIMEN